MDVISIALAVGAFVSAHGAEILGVFYALLNLANALASGPEAKSKIAALADFLAVLTRKDAAGTLKAPLLQRSRPAGEPASPSAPSAAIALFLAGSVALSGCACFRSSSEEYNSKKCVVARQVLDCTKDSLAGLLPLLPGIAYALMSGAAIDWAAVGQSAGDKGLANAACILAAVRADFASPEALAMAQASGLGMPAEPSAELAQRAGAELERLAAHAYGGVVDVRLPEAHGRRAMLKVRAAR